MHSGEKNSARGIPADTDWLTMVSMTSVFTWSCEELLVSSKT